MKKKERKSEAMFG